MASKKWYAIFSHTGSEVAAVAEALGRLPDAILTTNMNYQGNLPVVFSSSDAVNEFLRREAVASPGCLVTLHGYRRLLPAEVLTMLYENGCTCVNIHPAPIWMYPELRGIDPHRKMYDGVQSGKYTSIGVTLHHVDAGIDTGAPILTLVKEADKTQSYEQMCATLHDMGTIAWKATLPKLLSTGD